MKIIVHGYESFSLKASSRIAALTILYLKQALTSKFFKSTLVE